MKSDRTPLVKRLAILGPGLLGGSIGLAAKKHRVAGKVVIWGRRIESSQAALKLKAADRIALTPEDAVRGADLIILATPVEVMPGLVRSFRSKVNRKAIVTDVGSTKYDVVKHLSSLLAGRCTYIGSHPMAGAEKDGIHAAKADLFDGSVCILTPLPRARQANIKRLADFWQAIGCKIRTTSPSDHDELVAYISHLPHLVAAALVNLVERRKPGAFDFIGNGFRDMTRIASGPPDMWSQIALSNREEIRRSVDRLIEELETVRRNVANASDMELRAFLRRAKERRDDLKHRF